MIDRFKTYAVNFYAQLVDMRGTPAQVSMSFGVGVFLGILPGTGLIAAIGVAFMFRLNKPAVLLGCLLTNSWLSVVTFLVALKIGAGILGLNWSVIKDQALDVINHFSWKLLLDVSLLNILKPLVIGYAVVGFFCGVLGGVAVFILLYLTKKRPS